MRGVSNHEVLLHVTADLISSRFGASEPDQSGHASQRLLSVIAA